MNFLDFYKNKKIVIPGGNGFVGSHIARILKKTPCEIFVPKTKDGIDFRKYEDCFSYLDGKKPQIVINCAAIQGGIAYHNGRQADLFMDNMLMGTYLMKASQKVGVDKFINVVAGCSYPGYLDVPEMNEDDYWMGKLKYGQIQNGRFSYKDNFFDVCICLDVLEHVPDVDFFLKEVKRVLKKNGKFFLIVPCEGQRFTYTWLFQKTHLGENLTFRYLGHIHPEFTHKRVISLLQKHGFLIQEKAYSEHIFYQLLQFLVLFLPKILLEIFLGNNKANEYTNASLVKTPKSNNDSLLKVRNLWYKVWDLMMFYPMNWETLLLRRIQVTAWKLHVVAKK